MNFVEEDDDDDSYVSYSGVKPGVAVVYFSDEYVDGSSLFPGYSDGNYKFVKISERTKKEHYKYTPDYWWDFTGIVGWINEEKRTKFTYFATFDIFRRRQVPYPPWVVWDHVATQEAKIGEEDVLGYQWDDGRVTGITDANKRKYGIIGLTKEQQKSRDKEQDQKEKAIMDAIYEEWRQENFEHSEAFKSLDLQRKSGQSEPSNNNQSSSAIDRLSEYLDSYSLMVYAADFDPTDADNTIFMFPRSSRINGVLHLSKADLEKVTALSVGEVYTKEQIEQSLSVLSDKDVDYFKQLPKGQKLRLESIGVDSVKSDPGRIRLDRKLTIPLDKRTYGIVVKPAL